MTDSDPVTDATTRDAGTRRLDLALARLVASGRLTQAQAGDVRAEFAATPAGAGTAGPADAPHAPAVPVHRTDASSRLEPEPWRAILPEVGGYVGGTFVIAATVVLVGPQWDDLSRTLQVLLFAVPSVLLIAAGTLIATTAPGGWSPHDGAVPAGRRRVVAVLLTVGAALGAGAAAVLAGPDAPDRVAFTTAAALLLGAYAFCRIVLIHLTALLSCALAVGSWAGWWAYQFSATENPSVAIGLALGLLAAGWLAASVTGLLQERRVGVVAACAVFFGAAEILAVGAASPIATAVGYVLLAALAIGGFVGYVRSRFVGLLVVGVVGLATVVPQVVLDYTNGAIGAGGGLLLVGLSIIGASVLGFRLRRP